MVHTSCTSACPGIKSGFKADMFDRVGSLFSGNLKKKKAYSFLLELLPSKR